MKRLNSRKGFTLIELLVVIGILAVLVAIAIPSVAGLIDRANVSADQTNANEMTNSMERFASEYELYCQDIASGMVNIGNMDATQGRVYNVTGVTDRAGITALEVAPDAVVEEDQIAIYRDTKYPANAKTARLVVENYTKTSSSTFEPKQSDMNYWYSPDCGIVVFAEPEATVEQLNLLVQSGKDAKGNELSANTRWINLTEGADTERDEETAHGLYFDKTYSAFVDGTFVGAVFHRDGSAEIYFNGTLDTEIPAGLISYTNESVDLTQVGYGTGTISFDGKTVNIIGTDFVLQEQDISAISGEKYYLPNGRGAHLIFDEDGNIFIFDGNENFLMEIPKENISYTSQGFSISDVNPEFADFATDYLYEADKKLIIGKTSEGWDVFGRHESYPCDHRPIKLNGYEQPKYRSTWYEFYNDVTGEEKWVANTNSLSGFDGYTLRCSNCMGEIDYIISGNYIYIKNGYLEPQVINGERNLSSVCVDISQHDHGEGWSATPYDIAHTGGMLSTVNGQAITETHLQHGMSLPKTIKFIYTYQTFDDTSVRNFEVNYAGTKAQFAEIKSDYDGKYSILNGLMSYVPQVSHIETFVIHCSDGDLVIK